MTVEMDGPGSATSDIDLAALRAALAGQFAIERLLGRGGMGVVYLAREIELDRPVAIKVLPPAPATHPAVREQFLREARTAARLSHPNVVPIYQADEVYRPPAAGAAAGSRFVFFVMAYVDGPTLDAEVRRRGALPPAEVARIVRDVGWALAYAHARGIIHRDVKPENILLDRETGRALVTDFGIAQVAGQGPHTPAGRVIGSPHFMSPEQAMGRPVDERSDLYSLGAVAYYALTGRPPFVGAPLDVLRKQVTEAPPPLDSIDPTVPPALAEVVHRALAKRPEDRYGRAETFVDAVALSLGSPIPVPVRAWLGGGDEVRYFLSVTLALTGLAVANEGLWEEWAVFVAAALIASVAVELADVRRLMAAGYRLEDLRLAIDHVRAAVRARRGADLAPRRSAFDAALVARQGAAVRVVGLVIGVAAAVAAGVYLKRPGVPPEALGMALIVLAGLAVGGWPRLRGWRLLLRATLWGSRAGDLLARCAAWRLRPGPRAAHAPAGHTTPTPWRSETLLGRATRELAAALSPAAREELRALPATVRRLTHAADVLHNRVDELSRLLALYEEPADRRARAVDVPAGRDAVGHQLATAGSALDGIRAELLRLRADADRIHHVVAVLGSAHIPAAPAPGAVRPGLGHDQNVHNTPTP